MITLEHFITTLERMEDWHRIDESHGQRVAAVSVAIGKRLNGGERLNAEQLRLLNFAARIHDVGRVGIDNHVISKSGQLTQSQTAAMREHSQLGYDLLKESGLPPEITLTVLHHHEHWDGSGYPKGLKGLDIPLFARIVCVADTWDGIVSERPYHRARMSDIALDEMNKSVMWFDPRLFAVFLAALRDEGSRLT